MEKIKKYLTFLVRPLYVFLTIIAIGGFLIQIFYPEFYFSNQEVLQTRVNSYFPYDVPAFIGLQTLQVILAPISHYVVSILGGVLYGQWMGGIYNWIGRIIGHVIAYWIGRTIGVKIIKWIFSDTDLERYQKFVNGTKKTLHTRLTILFLMIFLPFFPDDELSYLVGLGGLNFKYYFIILCLGHLGGSFALAYLGAGIETKDPYFWFLTILTISLAILLIISVRRLGKMNNSDT